MQGLKQQLQDRQFHNSYLFYGEEHYLMHFYLVKMVNALLENGDKEMNYDEYQGQSIKLEKVFDAIETLPF